MSIRKIVSYLLIAIVMVFTVLAILGIWDIINLEKVMWKLLSTLVIIFASSAVTLFIFSVLTKDPESKD